MCHSRSFKAQFEAVRQVPACLNLYQSRIFVLCSSRHAMACRNEWAEHRCCCYPVFCWLVAFPRLERHRLLPQRECRVCSPFAVAKRLCATVSLSSFGAGCTKCSTTTITAAERQQACLQAAKMLTFAALFHRANKAPPRVVHARLGPLPRFSLSACAFLFVASRVMNRCWSMRPTSYFCVHLPEMCVTLGCRLRRPVRLVLTLCKPCLLQILFVSTVEAFLFSCQFMCILTLLHHVVCSIPSWKPWLRCFFVVAILSFLMSGYM